MELPENKKNNIGIFEIVILLILVVGGVALLIDIVYEDNLYREKANSFCESIGFSYEYPSNCYLDNDNVEYTIKIVYDHNRDEYHLLAPGEQQP
jgi:hypothetical protein